jgi:guanylate kinase
MSAEPHSIARRGLMLVLSSPSGAGKTTISRALLTEETHLTMSISVTTRAPRPGEQNGRDYFFVDEAEYHKMVKSGALLEHARVFDNFYGTPRTYVEQQLAMGRDVLFDIDWQGTQQLKASAGPDLVSVFILPPSIADLEKRLRGRAQDSDEVVKNRMARAADEMSHWPEYDYVIVNRDVEQSIGQVRAILTAERLRQRRRAAGLVAFVNSMRGQP